MALATASTLGLAFSSLPWNKARRPSPSSPSPSPYPGLWCCCSVEGPTRNREAFPRRQALLLGIGLGLGLGVGLAPDEKQAFALESSRSLDLRRYYDRFDGYTFGYPDGWMQVRGAGADIFFRDPINLDENVSVEISSPSSSRYNGLDDLGPPEQAAKKVLKQYLTEFMSTRLGVRRESKIVSSSSRVSQDGKTYYDIQVNVKSYANNNQLAVMPQDRVVELEWDRRYLSVLGVENNRLYELRLQVPERVLAKEEKELRKIMDSFSTFKV